jgi:hypothetical protein
MSTNTNGSSPDTVTHLKLGENAPEANNPNGTSFFTSANSVIGGITPTGTVALGAQSGLIHFNIQTNVDLVTPLTLSGNYNPNTGQAPQCQQGAAYSLAQPASLKMYAATLATTSPVSTASTGSGNYSSQDQVPDLANGGAPMAINHVPDWYLNYLASQNIAVGDIVARSFGIATIFVSNVSIEFLTVNLHDGTYGTLNILLNPSATFQATSQTTQTCTPFDTDVTTLGTSVAKNWNCTTGYKGEALFGCAGTTTGPAVTMQTITAPVASVQHFKIAVAHNGTVKNNTCSGAGTSNLGQPVGIARCANAGVPPGAPSTSGIPNNGPCLLNADPNAADALNNGIGDICRATGGSYANVDTTDIVLSAENANASAPTNAGLACTGFETSHTAAGPLMGESLPPFAACQDADQDGAINSVDNCPFTPNAPLRVALPGDNQQDTDHDGIGDACDPQPYIAGDGTGYVPGAITAVTTSGTIAQRITECDQAWTEGAGIGAVSCSNTLDSDADGTPDFRDTGTGACLQDHFADSNHDGYSDGDQAAPTTATTCTKFAGVGLGQDTIAAGNGCLTDPNLARSDINMDGVVNGLDLNQLGKSYLKNVAGHADPVGEKDFNHDGVVNGLDLNILGKHYLKSITANCTNVVVAAGQKDATGSELFVYFDRVPTSVHQVKIVCTGGGATPPLSTTGVTITVTGIPSAGPSSGAAVYRNVPAADFPCSVFFDTVLVKTFTVAP